nr:addiction module toxin RelE [uncultured Prevotella sp.]
MEVIFKYLPEFERRAKTLAKKYKSFPKNYDDFLDSLEKNPFQGISLGKNVYKTRMAVVSKGKGKSGGVRVLTYNVKKLTPERIVITFLSVFDKSDIENVSESYLKSLVTEARKNP